MLAFITLLVFVLLSVSSYILLTIFYRDKITVLSRLEKVKSKQDENLEMNELSIPFHQRVIKPIGDSLFNIISRLTPTGMANRVEERLLMAGKPYNLDVNRWFLIKAICGVVFPIMFAICFFIVSGLSLKVVLMLLLVTGMFNILPNLFLNQIIKNRQNEIIRAIPDVLDLLTVSVEAGLSFDGALARVMDKMEGVLTEEFGRVLNEMKMGKSRKEALRDMTARCGVPDLTTLVGSLIQADELGVGISNVLRIQSVQMREKRRQRAQEKAMKAPVKILFPLILFIFPTIFIVLLGPAIIRIMDTLVK